MHDRRCAEGAVIVALQTKLRRAYDLNGLTLAVEAVEPQLTDFLDPILAPLAGEGVGPSDWTVFVRRAAAIAPASGGRRIWEGPLPEGLHSILEQTEWARTLTVPDHFTIMSRRASRTIEIRVMPGRESGLRGTSAFWILDELLAAHGRHMLHGACLVDPKKQEAIVLFAPSGTGKTTAALALAHSGLHLGGDDAMVLYADATGCDVWAIPRKIKVHRRTAVLLAWLEPVLKDRWTGDEQGVDLDALRPFVGVAAPRILPVGLVIVLQPPNDACHAASALDRPEALSAIAADNIRVAPGGVDADNAAAFGALARLVAATPVIALSVGPDPGSLSPDVIGRG
jgi:hypothetical protein